ncbi:type II secretion system major pseudopilin GspG [Pseudomarimonas arenosa]|uniref:Type II secretion system core protein G n=1 Tax=Pseudomarimonas arenosa TaxID=2774145 RepID=A0AAW3ZKG1_9GAMM|nr:type II secretion system major pseudopilin GspG [Pseudomarimonas arenosa]MBD8526453.1 type II secretion system major pseudopilin GspG [Pseudomarimonas arenosa]
MNSKRFAVKTRGRQAGFTLIEILIVVGIIALIGTIVAGRIFGNKDRADYKLAESQLQTLAAKIDSYEQDTGELPSQLQDLISQPGNASSWLGPYSKESELKDPWNNQFEYRVPGQSGKFDLVSYGKDRKPGGDSYNRDIVFSP